MIVCGIWLMCGMCVRQAQCRNVVYAMLNPDAKRRIKASEVMRSEWMYNLDVYQ